MSKTLLIRLIYEYISNISKLEFIRLYKIFEKIVYLHYIWVYSAYSWTKESKK